MIQYQVRSVQLLNLVNDISSERLVTNPFFQRNLVWREIHKKDFIQTILLGYPFPQIFLSKGRIDLEKRISVASIVDGQQRCNAIMGYLNNLFCVDNKYFSDLSAEERSAFFKYEIAVIELDLPHDDPQVQEIFQRINRTANSLTGIEKKASEYSASEYMIVCQFMSAQLISQLSDYEEFDDDSSDEISAIKTNPSIDQNFKTWMSRQNIKTFQKLITSDYIFSTLEISKKVNLMYTINLVTSYLKGLYNRNEEAWNTAEDYSDGFEKKDLVVKIFENTAKIFLQFKFNKKSMWNKKANFFSLFLVLANNNEKLINFESLKEELDSFVPTEQYKIAAKEGVNNARERGVRNNAISEIISRHEM